MKKVPAYQADDGTLFTDRIECLMHDRKAEFGRWYLTTKGGERPNVLKLEDDNHLLASALIDYLIASREAILLLLVDPSTNGEGDGNGNGNGNGN